MSKPRQVIKVNRCFANVLGLMYVFQEKGKAKTQVSYKIWKLCLELCKSCVMYIFTTKPPNLSCKNAG